MTQSCLSKRIVRAVVASGLVALLTACATTPNVGTDVLTTGMANPEIALRESMRLVDAEMIKLRNPTDPSRRFRSIPAGDSDASRPLIPTHSSHP